MLFGGNSKACAYMTGYIINIIEDNSICGIDKIKSSLQKCAAKNQWRESDINTSAPWPSFKDESNGIHVKFELVQE